MILLVHHGQTEWNRDQRMQGRHDSPLTEEGRRQIHAVGKILKTQIAGKPRIVASPLGRAQITARLLAECLSLPEDIIETDERLIEIGLGA